jgi:hypothetical protein
LGARRKKRAGEVAQKAARRKAKGNLVSAGSNACPLLPGRVVGQIRGSLELWSLPYPREKGPEACLFEEKNHPRGAEAPPKFCATDRRKTIMGYDIRSNTTEQSGHCTVMYWAHFLDLAMAFGWVPEQDISLCYIGNVLPIDYQKVSDQDARAMAQALIRPLLTSKTRR